MNGFTRRAQLALMARTLGAAASVGARARLIASPATLGSLAAIALALDARDAHALEARTLVFPRDHGSHPDNRTEWWYVTGHASAGTGQDQRDFGFQVTFFRSRVEGTQGIESAFAAKQLLFAHAAVTDLKGGKLLHDQRIAREGFGIASASVSDAAIKLRDWSLVRAGTAAQTPSLSQTQSPMQPPTNAQERWRATVRAQDFALDLHFDATQPMLLQGQAGLSRKGPQEKQASYYYSQPQLRVSGTLALRGEADAATDRPGQRDRDASREQRGLQVRGTAWLDHEWSQEFLHPQAVGWDWIGMNLDDGSALTAFRLRTADGQTVWDGGSFRPNGSAARIFSAGETTFMPKRYWTSPMSKTRYPVEWEVRTPAGSFTVRALLDDQELDSRSSTGAIYWEGVSDLLDPSGARVGRGYLEMTGYAGPLKL